MQSLKLITALVIAAASSLVSIEAIAETQANNAEVTPLETIPETFQRAFFNESGYLFDNTKYLRQIDFIFGFGPLDRSSFPENEIHRDARLVNILYRDILEQQANSDPIIRVPDLANPFDSSLRSNPNYFRATQPVRGTEFVYERLPLR